VFVDAVRALRAQADAIEDAGIGLMGHAVSWQRIDPSDRKTWPPLLKVVLASDGSEPSLASFASLASFDTDEDRLRIHYGNWEGEVHGGWSFFVFPAPPNGRGK
jgi:hypothetical protein